jgi:hypothetical protein
MLMPLDVEVEWAQVVKLAREAHRRMLGEVRPIEQRSLMQPDGYVLCLTSSGEYERLPYTLESRVETVQRMANIARSTNAPAIALVVQGVAPLQHEGTIALRPALLLTVNGCGRFEGRVYEVVQQIEWTPYRVTAYGPVERHTLSGSSTDEWVSYEDPSVWPQIVWEL